MHAQNGRLSNNKKITDMPSSFFRAFSLACVILLTACDDDSAQQRPVTNSPVASAPDYWPTTAWQTAAPESHGFDSGALDTLANDAATALPYYTSLLVIKDGYIVHESYNNESDATTRHDVWSVTKSVTSLTLGRARTLGDLAIPAGITDKSDALDLTVADVFPTAAISSLAADDERRDISLRHTLQMRSGLAWNEEAWLLNDAVGKDPLLNAFSDPNCSTAGTAILLCSILQRPRVYEPGSAWNYDTYTAYLISGFFTGITGESLNSYASTNLFTPLGITFDAATDWPNLPAPYTFGGGLLKMRSSDLAKLGMLVLYNGQWDGQQLISREWMDMSLQAQGLGKIAAFDEVTGEPFDEEGNPLSDDGDIRYGMQWWRSSTPAMTSDDAITAIGLYGQVMAIKKENGLVIVLTCADGGAEEARDRYDEISQFIATHITDKLVP